MSLSPIEKNHTYKLAVQNALLSFQMIEESLKICVGLSYQIIAGSAPSPISLNFDVSAINKTPLGKLIKMFSGVSANQELIRDLRKIEEWRNFCAHRAYIHEFMSRQSGEPITAKDVEDVKIITTFSNSLVEQVGNDMLILREMHKALFKTEN